MKNNWDALFLGNSYKNADSLFEIIYLILINSSLFLQLFSYSFID